MDITTRPLTGADLDPVIAIDARTSGSPRRGYFEKRLRAATERPRDYVYVGLERDGALAGFALAKLADGEFGRPGAIAALDAIGVDPRHAGQGLGRALLDAVLEILAAKGVTRLQTQIDWPDRALTGFFAAAGFALAPRSVLVRATDRLPDRLADDPDTDRWDSEPDYSSPEGDDPQALSRDPVPVRALDAADLDRIVAIDRARTGTERRDYIARKLHESLHETGVRVSLVAEIDGFPAGFVMARVDFGEFGHAAPEAELDTLGVDPGHGGRGVGRALMERLIASLAALRVETLRTELDWNDTGLIGFFDHMGFAPAQRLVLARALS